MKKVGRVMLCLVLIFSYFSIQSDQEAFSAATAAPQLAAGYYHGVSLVSDGTVWTWGRGNNGQLGNGQYSSRITPVQVRELRDVKAITGGVHQGYAVLRNGTVWSWGSNSHGQLGDDTQGGRNAPRQIQGLSNIQSVSSGTAYHALALDADGHVWSWGRNHAGQLGNGTIEQSPTPAKINGLDHVTMIAAGGYFSLALKEDGSVWAWGANDHGQLGIGTTTNSLSPIQVQGLSGIQAIAAGGNHSLALDADGYVWTWGQNSFGALGDGSTTRQTFPVQITSLTDVKQIAGGGYHSLAVKEDGTVWSWGSNGQSQLGDGTTTQRNAPIRVQGLSDVELIAAGGFHSLAMRADGRVWSWGYNGTGELADGTTILRAFPVQSRAALDITPPNIDNKMLSLPAVATTRLTVAWEKAEDNLTKFEDLQYALYRSSNPNLQTVSQMESCNCAVGTYTKDIAQLDVTDLEAGETYYFNVIVEDLAGNKSAYQQQEVTTHPYYKVTYHGNEHTGGSVPIDDALYELGSEVKILANKGDLVREGYTFAGWNSEANGMGVDYLPDLTFSIASDIELYAKWIANQEELDVMTYYPEHGAGNIPIDAKLILMFNRDVTPEAGKSIRIKRLADDSIVELLEVADSAHVSVEGAIVRVETTALEYNTEYYVEIDESAFTDAYGFEYLGINAPNVWGFKTEQEEEDTDVPSIPPVIIDPPVDADDKRIEAEVEQQTPQLSKVMLNHQLINNVIQELVVKRGDGSDSSITLRLEGQKIEALLDQETEPPLIEISLLEEIGQINVVLSGDLVGVLEQQQGVVKVQSTYGALTIPIAQLPLDKLAKRMEMDPQNSLMEIMLQIAQLSEIEAQFLQQTTQESDYIIMSSPLQFGVTASYGEKTATILRYDRMIERELTLPQDIKPWEISTAVFVEKNGTMRHVPTRLAKINGQYVAIVQGWTEGIYALVRNPSTVVDVEGHWAEREMNDMVARMIIQGREGGYIKPDADITRAEFVTLIARALGLPETEASTFTDVPASHWSTGVLGAAQSYDIITGYEDGSFHPSKSITRQEGMVILSRILEQIDLERKLGSPEQQRVLADFSDQASIREWARTGVATVVSLDLVRGHHGELRVQSNLTRAEAATIIHRILERTNLINTLN